MRSKNMVPDTPLGNYVSSGVLFSNDHGKLTHWKTGSTLFTFESDSFSGMRKVRELVPPDGGWGWMVVIGCALVNFATRSIEPSFGLLFGSLLQQLQIATTGTGIIFSAYEAVISFSGILVGPLIKTYSYRKIAILGSILTSLGFIATYSASSMAHLLFTYSIINGLGVGFSSSATFVSINHYFKRRRGQAVGIAMTGTGLGLLLMPQAIRYLTEEYDFTGSILILGAFSLNACVGSALLQPVKRHLVEKKEDDAPDGSKDEECATNGEVPENALMTRLSTCPQISIDNTIAENDEEDEDTPLHNDTSFLSLASSEKTSVDIPRTRRVSEHRPKFYLKPDRKYSLIDREWKQSDEFPTEQFSRFVQKPINKSLTEGKIDKFFEESVDYGSRSGSRMGRRRKLSELSFGQGEVKQDGNLAISSSNIRKRKASTISNLSNLDFTGSCLHLHAIEQEIKSQGTSILTKNVANNNDEKDEGINITPKESWFRKFIAFMDFDLLKDPIYLNILFGISIFYVAEANFKMVVPFFLADLGHTKSETAFCLSMMAASDIVARLILPPICDRIKITRRTMFMVAALFCGASRSALAECGEWWIHMETILIISGFFRGATLINFMLVISEYCDEQMEKLPAAIGIHMVAKGLFIVAFGPLIGLIRDLTGSYPLCIHAQTILILICIFAWSVEYAVVKRKKSKPEKSGTG